MSNEATSFDRRSDRLFRSARDELYQLRRTRDQLVQIMDSLPGLVGYVDLNLTIVYANRLIEEWYQRPRSELVGMQLKALFTVGFIYLLNLVFVYHQFIRVLLVRKEKWEEVK